MANQTKEVKTSPGDIVRRFVGFFNTNEMDKAMALLAEDVFYHNIPMAPMTGREAVRSFTAEFGVGTKWRANWEISNLAENGEIVLTERLDAFQLADGREVKVPLMGSFRVRNGLIAEWRDYFDLADFGRQLDSLLSALSVPLPNSEDA